jgi:predicted phosphohydrolase
MGKILIILGAVLIGLGLIIQYGNRIPFLGKLPGDIIIEKGNLKIYFPIATSILLSVLLSVVLYLINKFKN